MVSLTKLLKGVQTIKARSPTYREGGSGKDGTCDCVGVPIGAMERAGHKKYPIHCSNYFARYQTDDMVDLNDECDCFLGEIVYKREDSTSDLNARYLEGGRYYTGDERDYYHVGIVTSVDPFSITHCTSGGGVNGITVDTRLGNWDCGGRLKGVDYDEYLGGDISMAIQFASVTSENGLPVKLRSSKSTKNNDNVIVKLPVDKVVRIQEENGDWNRVECSHEGQAYSGYMMAKFLEPCDAPDDTEDTDTDVEETVNPPLEARVDELERLFAEMNERLSAAGL